ncbi:MAG TPA: DM13 domain-containing protein [Nitrososphaeraceae archaeon]|nr:DM13 domain-containing protein [Nitrososphaeraceae archaeon]
MDKKIKIAIGGVIVVIVIAITTYTISPFFINTSLDEPLPDTRTNVGFDEFMKLSEDERATMGKDMTDEEKGNIMKVFAQENITINNKMTILENQTNDKLTGNLIDSGDGFHMASGQVKLLQITDGTQILRFENLDVTNGPDLYVYLATDTTAKDFISLGRLKGNMGNQNYPIPENIDFEKYNTVLIWCQAFSTLFGSSKLSFT